MESGWNVYSCFGYIVFVVYLARDIPAFVMYCVNGASRSSLLIESTDYDI